VLDVIQELASFGAQVLVFDPVANPKKTKEVYGIDLVDLNDAKDIDAVVAAVPHESILDVDVSMLSGKCNVNSPFIDVKSAFDRVELKRAGFCVWRL